MSSGHSTSTNPVATPARYRPDGTFKWAISAGSFEYSSESFAITVERGVGPIVGGYYEGASFSVGPFSLFQDPLPGPQGYSAFVAQYGDTSYGTTLTTTTTGATLLGTLIGAGR